MWFETDGDWPEYAAPVLLAEGGTAAATAAAVSVQVARSKLALEDTYWFAGTDDPLLYGIENYDVASGFVFLET